MKSGATHWITPAYGLIKCSRGTYQPPSLYRVIVRDKGQGLSIALFSELYWGTTTPHPIVQPFGDSFGTRQRNDHRDAVSEDLSIWPGCCAAPRDNPHCYGPKFPKGCPAWSHSARRRACKRLSRRVLRNFRLAKRFHNYVI